MRTETELMKLKKNELVEIAESLNADTSGTKAELTKRILTLEVYRMLNQSKITTN